MLVGLAGAVLGRVPSLTRSWNMAALAGDWWEDGRHDSYELQAICVFNGSARCEFPSDMNAHWNRLESTNFEHSIIRSCSWDVIVFRKPSIYHPKNWSSSRRCNYGLGWQCSFSYTSGYVKTQGWVLYQNLRFLGPEILCWFSRGRPVDVDGYEISRADQEFKF